MLINKLACIIMIRIHFIFKNTNHEILKQFVLLIYTKRKILPTLNETLIVIVSICSIRCV